MLFQYVILNWIKQNVTERHRAGRTQRNSAMKLLNFTDNKSELQRYLLLL